MISNTIPAITEPSPISSSSRHSKGSSSNQLMMDDFLQLLTSQITNQDPLEPMKDTEFISQMANIASLEQMQQFSSGFSKFADSQQSLTGQGFLGKEVTINDNSQEIIGLVESVEIHEDGSVSLFVNGSTYSSTLVTRVSLPKGVSQ